MSWQDLRLVGGMAALIAFSSSASAQLLSIDEAVSMSKRTGRPVFALAGSKT